MAFASKTFTLGFMTASIIAGASASSSSSSSWIASVAGSSSSSSSSSWAVASTYAPTGAPTGAPSTAAPTGAPTGAPSTAAPTASPTTAAPTKAPTVKAGTTSSPTASPTYKPETTLASKKNGNAIAADDAEEIAKELVTVGPSISAADAALSVAAALKASGITDFEIKIVSYKQVTKTVVTIPATCNLWDTAGKDQAARLYAMKAAIAGMGFNGAGTTVKVASCARRRQLLAEAVLRRQLRSASVKLDMVGESDTDQSSKMGGTFAGELTTSFKTQVQALPANMQPTTTINTAITPTAAAPTYETTVKTVIVVKKGTAAKVTAATSPTAMAAAVKTATGKTATVTVKVVAVKQGDTLAPTPAPTAAATTPAPTEKSATVIIIIVAAVVVVLAAVAGLVVFKMMGSAQVTAKQTSVAPAEP